MQEALQSHTRNCNNKLVEPVPPSSTIIVGTRVYVQRAFTNGCQSCGGHEAVLESGKGPNLALIRCVCGQFRGWLAKATGHWLAREIAANGRPDLADIHNGRVVS